MNDTTTTYYTVIRRYRDGDARSWFVAIGTSRPNPEMSRPTSYNALCKGRAWTAAGARRKARRWLKETRKNDEMIEISFNTDDEQLTKEYEHIKKELNKRGLKL